MATLGEYLLGIARDLKDAERGHEFARWSREQLVDYINEGVRLAAIFKPDLFTVTKTLKLSPGSEQQACGCSTITQVIGQVDEHGELVGGYLPKRSSAAQFGWRKPGCPAPHGPFRLTGYWSDPMAGPSFTVTPPVPLKPDVFVKVKCVENPEPMKAGRLKAAFDYGAAEAAIRQWVLYRAIMVDDESANNIAVADGHLKLFFTLLQVQFSRELVQKLGTVASPQTKEALSILRTAGVVGRAV